MNRITAELERLFRQAGAEPDPAALERFEAFHSLLTERNRMMDLTSVPEEEMPRRHYLDSVLPLLLEPALIAPTVRIMDVGSGAGFPGVPLAILRPEQPIALLEATGRRCDFLSDVIERLHLDQVRVVPMRAEEAGRRPEHRERYDVTVSRAVAALNELLEYMLPLTAVGGKALCWKGQKAGQEIAEAAYAASVLGGASPVERLYTAEQDSVCVVTAFKLSPAPEAYPRRPGIPHKRPLKRP